MQLLQRITGCRFTELREWIYWLNQVNYAEKNKTKQTNCGYKHNKTTHVVKTFISELDVSYAPTYAFVWPDKNFICVRPSSRVGAHEYISIVMYHIGRLQLTLRIAEGLLALHWASDLHWQFSIGFTIGCNRECKWHTSSTVSIFFWTFFSVHLAPLYDLNRIGLYPNLLLLFVTKS